MADSRTTPEERLREDGRRTEPVADRSLVRAAPVLAWLALAAGWRATEWTIETYVRVGVRLARAAAAGESPAELMQDASTELRDLLRRLLGVADESAANGAAAAPPDMPSDDGPAIVDETPSSRTLRELGAELLRRSADLRFDEDGHPAYARILQELAPDEARILRLLVLEGPQPSIDVRTGGPLGVIKSDLIAPGLTMIGHEAGCLHPERIAPYLNNLYRLGLIWFSREQLDDIQRYQVLEAQPDVAEAMGEAGRAKTVRRSIHLTPFGEDFCRTCLPLDTAEIDARPAEPPAPDAEP